MGKTKKKATENLSNPSDVYKDVAAGARFDASKQSKLLKVVNAKKADERKNASKATVNAQKAT